MTRNKKNEPQQNTSEIIGRISGADPEQEAKSQKIPADISYVDQQEGNMNNGACGGNFDTFNSVKKDPSADSTRDRG